MDHGIIGHRDSWGLGTKAMIISLKSDMVFKRVEMHLQAGDETAQVSILVRPAGFWYLMAYMYMDLTGPLSQEHCFSAQI